MLIAFCSHQHINPGEQGLDVILTVSRGPNMLPGTQQVFHITCYKCIGTEGKWLSDLSAHTNNIKNTDSWLSAPSDARQVIL